MRSAHRPLQRGKDLEHCRLPPVQHRRLGGHQRILTVIEAPRRALHMPERPRRDPLSEFETSGIVTPETRQRVDSLGGALDVDGKRAGVIILRPSRFLEEMLHEELETAAKAGAEFIVADAVEVGFQTVEIVTGMKVVDPVIFPSLGVPPRSVRVLSCAAISHGGPCDAT